MCNDRLSVNFLCHGCKEMSTCTTMPLDLNSTAHQSLDIPPPMFDISTIPNLTSDTNMSRGGDKTGAVVLEDM